MLLAISLNSQEEKTTFTKRVLFILDGSGSMNERWHGESKWDMAVQTLSNLIDSFEQTNRDFEIGIRVLGHQYPRAQARCEDTKLEMPFATDLNFEKVNTILRRIHPKGMTPLAFAISQAEIDFTTDVKAQNIIILITDGLENCDGNPCVVATRLREKNIFINPYIIGLGIDSLQSQKLECIGKFIDAKNKAVFKEVIKTIFTEVSKKTTLTINFIQSDSTVFPYYVPYTLIDKRTKNDIHSYIFTSSTKRNLDTIQVNPQYQYDLLVHTNPPFFFDSFQIIKGTHQHYTIPISAGKIDYESPDRAKKNLYLLHNNDLNKTHWQLGVQPLVYRENSNLKIETIQHPLIKSTSFNIKENSTKSITHIHKGNLILKKQPTMMATIYTTKWEKILTIDNDIINTFELIIGDYFILYNDKNAASESSKFQTLKIIENQTTQLLLQ